MTLIQRRIIKLLADGLNYPEIAEALAVKHPKFTGNHRLVRHYACEAVKELCPATKLPTQAALALWWERRKG